MSAANSSRGLPPIPPHVGVFLGLSTAAYAVSLATVSIDQATAEAADRAAKAPVLSGLDAVSSRNAQLAADLQQAGADYNAVAQAYLASGGTLADLETALASLSSSVSTINGAAAKLPASIPLPKISTRVTVVAAPATHATTGASGAP